MLDQLMNPSFAADPPVKLNVPAKTLGLILAILGAIGAFFGILGVFALLGLSALAAAYGGIFILALVGVIISEIGTIVGAWGGYQMYQEKREGKKYAIYGVLLSVVGGLIAAIGGSGGLVGWVISTLISFCIYYLIVISRFPGEAPLVATTTTPPPSTP